LIALINQSNGKPAGLINPLLYQNASAANDFNDVVSGNNGAYKAGAGWDACTGLGSPNGGKVLAALAAQPAKRGASS
jgi:kumamolisin